MESSHPPELLSVPFVVDIPPDGHELATEKARHATIPNKLELYAEPRMQNQLAGRNWIVLKSAVGGRQMGAASFAGDVENGIGDSAASRE